MSKLVVWILAASLSGGVSVLPAQAVNSIVFGANSGSCGRTVLCSSDGTHGYLTNGKGQAFKASTISKWLQIDADGKSHLKGQGVEPLRSAGAFVAMNDTGRPITKFALRIATDKKTCAGAMAAPCNAFSAKGGTGSFHYEAMLTARDRHNCTQGKTMRDICMGDPVSASFASNKVLYSWTAKPQGAIPAGAYFVISFSGWTSDAWAAPPDPPSIVMLSKASDGTPGDGRSQTWVQFATLDGNRAVFESAAFNLPGSSTSNETVYIYDRPSGMLTPISTAIDRPHAPVQASISMDGGYVGFYGVQNCRNEFYIFDVAANSTQTIHISPPVTCLSGGMMSFDGQYFMYTGTTDEGSQVLSYDRIAGTTTEMLAPDGSLPDNAGCTNLASTGQYNVVGCTSDNIVADICCTVYLWDQSTNTFEDLERSTDGGEGIPAGYNDASISPDGRYVAFVSLATDLVPGGTSGQQVFMYDRQTGVTQLVSAAADGTQGNATNDEQGHGRVTPDGRFVLFNSNATNLVGDVNNTGLLQLYLKDLQTGDIQEISVASDGTPGDSNSTMPAISADAAYVYSRATTAI